MGGNTSHENIIYNVPLEGTKQKGFSHIYRNPLALKELHTTPQPELTSIKDAIYTSFQKNKDRDYLGRINISSTKNGETIAQERTLTKFTYGQIFDMAQKLGSFLLNNKMEFHENLHNMKLIGIFSKNRYEWIVADLACILYGMTIVPLYDTLGIQNLTYCLEHSGITTLFVTAGTIKTLLGLKGHGNLQNLICLDKLTPQVEAQLKSHKFKVYYFQDALKQAKMINHHQTKVTGKNCLTFSYTSGTTGPPKAAMLSHANFLGFLAGAKAHQINAFKSDDVYLSFLPLPHVFQRVLLVSLTYRGAFIVSYSGDITKLKDDAAFVKPTLLIGVPRIFNRIVQNVEKTFQQSSTGIKGCLIKNGVQSKMDTLRQNGKYSSGFYDALVFSKVRQKFGGRVRLMVTGSAPIKKEVYQQMKILMCCPFLEGYGQTQNTAAASLTNCIDPTSNHSGGITTSLQLKLNDIQEMHYTSQDKDEQGRPTPRGQIWLRGPCVFMGYYKDKEKTLQAITPDGWLKTGDVGMIVPGINALKIIDRRKNIFKLQQGEYVAAEKVQAVYTRSHLISQVFLHGQSLHNFAIAIIVPQKNQLLKLAQKHSIKGTFEEICQDKNLRIIVCKQMDSIGKQGGLNSFEQAKNIYFDPQLFLNRGLLSSTMKLQRFMAKKYYSNQIEAMYNEGPLVLK